MLNTICDTVFNSLLIGTSTYAMLMVSPLEHPFAFTASTIGLCHGFVGICNQFMDPPSEDESSDDKYINRAENIFNSCMEIAPVPLINIELYRMSQQTNALALGHGFFIIPLAFDLVATEGDGGESTEVLKELTIVGNIVSLTFLSANENNLYAGIMAFSAFVAYYGAIMMEGLLSGTQENTSLAGYSLFFAMLPQAIKATATEVGS